MLRTPIFWLMFAMMTLMSTTGLMVTSQLATFARDFGVGSAIVWGFAAIPLALTLDRFTNGLTRPFFGAVSDRIGRENTMAIAFALEGVAMLAWLATSSDPVLFVLLSGVVFFGWGEIFSLFPSTLTDTFGPRHATQNYGWLYMAQGIGSILGGPMATQLHEGDRRLDQRVWRCCRGRPDRRRAGTCCTQADAAALSREPHRRARPHLAAFASRQRTFAGAARARRACRRRGSTSGHRPCR